MLEILDKFFFGMSSNSVPAFKSAWILVVDIPTQILLTIVIH